MDQADLMKLLQGLLAQQKAPAKSKGKRKGKKQSVRGKLTDAEKAVFMAKNDSDAVAAFTAAGYKDVKPRENVLTYGKWAEKGRLVKRGQKAIRVNQFNLFHVDQTEPAPAVIGA